MIDAEAAVLGAVLVDSAAFWRVSDLLTADDFGKGGHRRMWETVADMLREGTAVDCYTVGEREPGLAQLAFDLSGSGFVTANVRTYGEIVAKRATERRVLSAGQRIATLRGDDTLGEAQRILATCSPRNTSAVKHAKKFLSESVNGLQERLNSDSALTGVATSLPALDELTSGWQPSDLIILAARPSVGKTALALQCALHAAGNCTPTLFFSAEMSGRQLIDRAICHLSGVSLKSIRAPRTIDGDEWTRINRAGEQIAGMPLFIDDSSGQTIDGISGRARQLDAEHRLGLIVVDYLTHLALPKAETVAESIQIATRQLKGLAKSLNVPVLLLSQLNRDGDHKPNLTTLRGSGAIEQDADVIAFLHRPDPKKRHLLTLDLAKQRNGECGDLWLHADMAHMRFNETEEHTSEPGAGSGFRSGSFGGGRDRAAGN